jgi:phosphatidylserine/phosphatidylglycerophosphate/cardiolipin synthase-like enzyme
MVMETDDGQAPLLRPGDTCWRLEEAERAAFLIDSADYFAALKSVLLSARRSIWILAWTFDPLARLTPDRTSRSRDPEHADRLGLLLRRLAALNPALDVRVLAWDMPVGIAASQLFAGQRGKAYFKDSRVDYRLDDSLPKSACHHQKVIVVDGRIAFVSGGDVGADRWDTHDHLDHDPRRRLPTGHSYPARHEVTVMIEGQAAVDALSDMYVQRWSDSGGETLVPPETPGVAEDSIWPEHVEPDLWNHRLGIARTGPHWKKRPGSQEILALHLAAIAAARKTLYIENQYLTASVIVYALAQRLAEPDGPEIVVVGPDQSPSSFDRLTMDCARQNAIRHLREADIHGRFHAYSARTAKGKTIIVHSKVVVVDDRLVRIGSANLNNRSMGLDTECDVALESLGEPHAAQTGQAILAFRNRLIGHYIGRSGREIEAAVRLLGGLGAAIDSLDNQDQRRLAPVVLRPPSWLQKIILHWKLGDPTSPQDAWRPWRRRRWIRDQIATLLEQPARPPAEDPAPPATADDPTRSAPDLRTASLPS